MGTAAQAIRPIVKVATLAIDWSLVGCYIWYSEEGTWQDAARSGCIYQM